MYSIEFISQINKTYHGISIMLSVLQCLVVYSVAFNDQNTFYNSLPHIHFHPGYIHSIAITGSVVSLEFLGIKSYKHTSYFR